MIFISTCVGVLSTKGGGARKRAKRRGTFWHVVAVGGPGFWPEPLLVANNCPVCRGHVGECLRVTGLQGLAFRVTMLHAVVVITGACIRAKQQRGGSRGLLLLLLCDTFGPTFHSISLFWVVVASNVTDVSSGAGLDDGFDIQFVRMWAGRHRGWGPFAGVTKGGVETPTPGGLTPPLGLGGWEAGSIFLL